MVKMKRAVVKDFLNYVEEKYSVDDIEKARQILSPEDYAELFGLHSGSWISFQSLINFNIAMDQLIGQGDLKLIDELAEETSTRNFKGLYKIFLSLLTPKSFINNIPRIWNQQLDQGECSVSWRHDHSADLIITNWEPPLYHDLLQIPYHVKAISIAGGKNVLVTHPKCIVRGDGKCVFHYEFD